MQTLPKRIMAILAHPDDESFAMGGTLAKYAHLGVQVFLLCATRGEAGIAGVQPEEAGVIREGELRIAAQHLGIEVIFLDYHDGELASAPYETLVETIAGWIQRIQPQVIFTFGPDGVSGHPDHVTISHAVTSAYDQLASKGMLLYIHPSEATVLGCGVSESKEGGKKPLIRVDIADHKLEKARAILSHTSQSPDLPDRLEEAIQRIPSYEVYAVARRDKLPEGSIDWFEKQLVEEPE